VTEMTEADKKRKPRGDSDITGDVYEQATEADEEPD